ncbi:hypothetical protein HOO68_05235 [Candidatus Gracilibacteria bacterium]|nr:hypothetical protein [Candidatus Gracilibacteria bacterium]
MNSQNKIQQYCADIDTISRVVISMEKKIQDGSIGAHSIREIIISQVDSLLVTACDLSIEELHKCYTGVDYFLSRFGKEDAKIQVGKLFGFRSDKLRGDVTVISQGPILLVSFSEMQDLLSVKFAKRKEQFVQDDRASGFYKTVYHEGYRIPVCVTGAGFSEESTIVHELTHFRNDILGLSFYSQGGGRDIYEMRVYDDLQEEILAFFSEGLKRSAIQMVLAHDQRYHFYRRIEDWSPKDQERFLKDISKYVGVAREVKDIRPDTYIVDLAIIPIHQWPRYLRYIKQIR